MAASNRFAYWVSRALLGSVGWRTGGSVPDAPRYVLIAAPHTSNWDGVLLILAAFVMGVPLHWMVKHTMLRPPMGWLLRRLGAVPVDRRARHDMVRQMVELFANADRFVLAIPPEGTRAKAPYWKTGFYRIATGANVPIAMGYLDYARKEAGIGPVFVPTGDLESDARGIRDFYEKITARVPANFTNAVFAPSSESGGEAKAAPST